MYSQTSFGCHRCHGDAKSLAGDAQKGGESREAGVRQSPLSLYVHSIDQYTVFFRYTIRGQAKQNSEGMYRSVIRDVLDYAFDGHAGTFLISYQRFVITCQLNDHVGYGGPSSRGTLYVRACATSQLEPYSLLLVGGRGRAVEELFDVPDKHRIAEAVVQ